MKATIKDIASKANVSIATVSRILNNMEGYSDETKDRVMKVIKELNYYPNALAKSLAGAKMQTFGVLIPYVSSMVASEMLSGIEDEAHKQDYNIIICDTKNDGERTMEYLKVLREKQVDGLIIVSENLKDEYIEFIKMMNVDVVMISSMSREDNFSYIKVDDYQASYDAVNYLISNGHKKIAMISGTETDKISGIPRIKGYKDALQDNNLIVNEKNITYGNFSFESGYLCMENLIKSNYDITAVFCASDEMAVGVISCCYKHKMKVPDEISVIGYDNTRLAKMSTPSLTVVSQPFYDMGCDGIRKLIKKLSGEKISNYIVPHKIEVRDSVKRI